MIDVLALSSTTTPENRNMRRHENFEFHFFSENTTCSRGCDKDQHKYASITFQRFLFSFLQHSRFIFPEIFASYLYSKEDLSRGIQTCFSSRLNPFFFTKRVDIVWGECRESTRNFDSGCYFVSNLIQLRLTLFRHMEMSTHTHLGPSNPSHTRQIFSSLFTCTCNIIVRYTVLPFSAGEKDARLQFSVPQHRLHTAVSVRQWREISQL